VRKKGCRAIERARKRKNGAKKLAKERKKKEISPVRPGKEFRGGEEGVPVLILNEDFRKSGGGGGTGTKEDDFVIERTKPHGGEGRRKN